MAKRRIFDEDSTRPGVQGMPTVTTAGRRTGDPNAGGYDALRRYVDAQMDLQRAQQDADAQAQAGSPMAAYMARRRAQQARQNVATAGAATQPAKQRAAEGVTQAANADPVVSVPTSTDSTSTMPAAPVSVTDPASEISPEEQNARLRARILLMSGGTRGGGLIGTTKGQLGLRSLLGF